MVILGALVLPIAATAAPATASKPTVAANGVIRVTVTSPAAGTAELSAVRIGTAPVGMLCATAAEFAAAGEEQELFCSPTATAQKIGRNGAMRLKLTLAFTPVGGTRATTPLGVVVVPRLPVPTVQASDLKQLRNGSVSVRVSMTGPGIAVVVGTNDPGLMCTGRANFATQGSKTMICVLTPFGVFLHEAGNMFLDVSLQFTPASGRTTTVAVGRLLVPMA
jgi:hypothetical protein